MATDKKRIWWLASFPKSGSTWARLFMNAYITGFPIELNSAWQYVSGDLQPHWYQMSAAVPVTEMDDIDAIYYRSAVLMNHIYTSRTRDLALKTHHAKVEIDGIPLIPPRLSKGAVYIIRDPRDVAPSFADHMGVDVDRAIELMGSNESSITKDKFNLFHILMSWSTHVDSWTVRNKDVRTTVVRYEDLLAEPDTAFRVLLTGLGVEEVKEDRFAFAMEQTDFRSLKDKEQQKRFLEKGKGESFFRQGRSQGWRDSLTTEQVETIERNHGATMHRWGYKVSAAETRPLETVLTE